MHFLSHFAKENRGVAAVEPGGKQQSPGLLHLNVRVQKTKKDGHPKVSVLVRQKGLEPLTY